MSRISIDVTNEEHRILKAKAALKGVSMKEFLVGPALAPVSDDEESALAALERELDRRLAESAKIGPSRRTVKDIFQQAYLEAETGKNA